MSLTISQVFSQATSLVEQKTPIVLRGTVRTYRAGKAGKLHFIWITDGSTMKQLQGVYPGQLAKLDYLSSVELQGTLIMSPGKGQDWEVAVTQVTVIGDCPPESFPIPRNAQLPFLRQYPHLRMRVPTIEAIMRVRHQMWMTIMEFFHSRGYISMHTPIITGSDCEGAGEAFKVDGGKDFFPKSAYLTVSGQLEGEMAATALGKIFTCGPTFRAEHSDTPRHLSEFWMVEPEMAWHDLDDTITVAQELITACVTAAVEKCQEELKILEHTKLQQLEYHRITYTEAIKIVQQHAEQFEVVPKWGEDLGTPHERFLSDVHFKQPVVITHYPREMKAFYMHQDSDGKTVACFDLLLPGIGEAIGGSQREIRPDVLEKGMQERGLDPKLYSKYLDLRRFGNVPHSGFGLGFERIVRYVTGVEHIRDVIPFPVYYQHLS